MAILFIKSKHKTMMITYFIFNINLWKYQEKHYSHVHENMPIENGIFIFFISAIFIMYLKYCYTEIYYYSKYEELYIFLVAILANACSKYIVFVSETNEQNANTIYSINCDQ